MFFFFSKDFPPYQPQSANRRPDSAPTGRIARLQLEGNKSVVSKVAAGFLRCSHPFIRSFGSGEEEEGEELHGKLEEDRFLFSLENNSAAYDVLDLREVLSVFLMDR